MTPTRPYVLASVAMSLDGYIDDNSGQRLILSNALDLAKLDEIRAEQDAILVGANTIRKDNPSLSIKSPDLRKRRVDSGRNPDLVKVTLTASGQLAANSRFFEVGAAEKLVYCPHSMTETLQSKLGPAAHVIGLSSPSPHSLLEDLGARNIRKLLLEGGEKMHTAFLEANLVDELRVAIAPFFVGGGAGQKFVQAARFPFDKNHSMKLKSIEQLGDMAILTYHLA
ncbi:MAG: dihydrofolate reductase family protein [Deltaproteobacteria bacterium]|nr:dihydrofolate reductase family protein [Deltaproteobacteria bacterium]